MLKKAWKIVLAVVLALLVVVLGYVAYVFIDYHRIGNQELTVERNAAATVEAGKEYGILSYNIGFGAYEDDYSFFMDGGTESRAWSEERLTANIERIGAFLQQQDADLYLLQEVDRDSTRSYHVDEGTMLTAQLPGLGYTWAQNYDSPYLFYPLDQPHGKSVSGLLTLSSFGITETRRVELPIEAGVMKLVDLDRCYSVHRIPAADGRELVLYNVHLSAYTSDGTIAVEQLELLRDRVSHGGGFPHEIGFFLGYPLADVLGFLALGGECCRMSGYWKVYGDVEQARAAFRLYDELKMALTTMLAAGFSFRECCAAQTVA